MTRYHESIAQSAEYLRLALPLMSQQAAAMHPISYSVWYEYVSGINQPLRQAVDTLLKAGKVLDENATEELYHTYITEQNARAVDRLTNGVSEVLIGVAAGAADAGNQAQKFGKDLEKWGKTLAQGVDAAQQESGLKRLAASTRNMQGAIGTLQERLDDSRGEIERLRQELSRAQEEARIDSLTGLPNRRGFETALDACLAELGPNDKPPCLLFADLDRFKQINDTCGHLTGDKVLRAVAKILKTCIKGQDTAARYGGEEFVVLLPETHLVGAQAVAEKIRHSIEKSRIRRLDTQEEIAQVTLSLGVACYCPGESASDFLARADAALYTSKSLGRNRVTTAPLRLKL